MSKVADDLRRDMEAAARRLGIAPSTLGEKCGQGGHFYRRLCEGKRVWPETADAVRARIHDLIHSADEDAA